MISSDESLVGLDGQVRHFSKRAFIKLADDSSRCFVCGANSSECQFDDEHVVPSWLLRRYQLHSRRITLPNGSQMIYGRYKIRCCKRCNQLLGRIIEAPVSQIFVQDVGATVENIQAYSLTFLYQWLCLLFIKHHLKDRDVLANPDARIESGRLSEIHNWEGLHHIHSVARAAQSGAKIDESVPGTVLFIEMNPEGEEFDIGTLPDYSTILVRIGSMGIVGVLNDCGFVGAAASEYLSKISGHSLSAIQLREVAAILAYTNTLLKNRPDFWSELERDEILTIRSRPPRPVQFEQIDRVALGGVIASTCGDLIMKSHTPGPMELIQRLRQGNTTFLFNDDGTFKTDSFVKLSK